MVWKRSAAMLAEEGLQLPAATSPPNEVQSWPCMLTEMCGTRSGSGTQLCAHALHAQCSGFVLEPCTGMKPSLTLPICLLQKKSVGPGPLHVGCLLLAAFPCLPSNHSLLGTYLCMLLHHHHHLWLQRQRQLHERHQRHRHGLQGGSTGGQEQLLENGVHYAADLGAGQKTGFFCDQRDSRALIRSLASGSDVLDLCCYTGGFALSAALGGASSVVGLPLQLL